MTLVLGVLGFLVLCAIWERLDTLRDDISDLVWLLEDSARPSHDAEGTTRRARRPPSRR